MRSEGASPKAASRLEASASEAKREALQRRQKNFTSPTSQAIIISPAVHTMSLTCPSGQR